MEILKTMNLYFTDSSHKYVDDEGSNYTSVTTLIHKFEEQFDGEFWSKAKGIQRAVTEKHGWSTWNDYLRNFRSRYGYENSWKELVKAFELKHPEITDTYQAILKSEWKAKADKANTFGTAKHLEYENVINAAIGFNGEKTTDTYKVFTIQDIISNKNNYITDISQFDKFKDDLPELYDRYCQYITDGYTIFSELVTYDPVSKVCGTIDIPIIHFDNRAFIIDDWKTNEAKLQFEAGYFKKVDGVITEDWVRTDAKMLAPLGHMDACTGNTYTMQLSTYAHLTEMLTGFRCEELNINHLERIGKNKVQLNRHKIKYRKKEVELMLEYK